VGFADPVCPHLAEAVAQATERAGGRVVRGGTYVCMEGPQFSSRAESLLYRNWGVSVIGMTAMPEAKLAREAQLPYATVALATDYDCWHETEEAVTVDNVIEVLHKNSALARQIIKELAANLPDPKLSHASSALASAILTRSDAIPPAAWQRLGWLIGPAPLRAGPTEQHQDKE
jgi:5'-methylthioadenosine phosphorylase